MEKKLISSHIFVFPFKWDTIKSEFCLDKNIEQRLDVNEFIKNLDKKYWQEDSCIKTVLDKEKMDNDVEYNKYIYFYENVRKAIYGRKKEIKKETFFKFDVHKNRDFFFGSVANKKISDYIVSCFERSDVNADSTYEISTNDKTYKLKLKNIKLKIYDTGVATLSYFAENYEVTNSSDILKINDYGRRIYPQFLSISDVRKTFLAKKVSIKLQGKIIEEDFDYGIKENPNQLSKIIIDILGENFISSKEKLESKKQIFIRPVIDDRMFVICYYNNNDYSRILKNKSKEAFFNKNDFWYQFLFVDNGGSTCEDEEMKKELILKSTYFRWKNSGALYGVSRYSFVLLCDESPFSKGVLYNHMNGIYYEMVLLALVQRASILRFSNEVSKIAASIKSEKTAESIKKLQEYYIKFVNNIYFREITAQEQGIELYDNLLKMMRIEKEVKRLDEEIDEIHRYINLKTSEKTNKLINIITILGVCVAILTLNATLNSVDNLNVKWIVNWQIIPLFLVFLGMLKVTGIFDILKKFEKVIIAILILITIFFGYKFGFLQEMIKFFIK